MWQKQAMLLRARVILVMAVALFGLGLVVAGPPIASAQSTEQIICGNIKDAELRKDCQRANENTLGNTIRKVMNPILLVAGAVAVVMIIIGGLRYVTSAGNQEAISAAKNTILYAVLGLIVVILAFAIVNFVFGSLFRRNT